MKNYFDRHDIRKYVAQSPDVKAALAERCIRTIKTRLYKYFTEKQTMKWVDVIDKIVNGVNNSVHRIIKMRPNDVTPENADALWERLYGDLYEQKRQPMYKEGDNVRISKEKGPFAKGYVPNYSHEIFKIDAVKLGKDPPNYRLVDQKGEEIVGKFYNEEFSKAVHDETLYPTMQVDKVLNSRMRRGKPEFLVTWKGLPPKTTTWIRRNEE
jgi:hypothetical protein